MGDSRHNSFVRDTLLGVLAGTFLGAVVAGYIYHSNAPENQKSCSGQTIEIPYAAPVEKIELILQDLDQNHRFEVYRKDFTGKEFILELDENCEPVFMEYKHPK